MGVIADLLIRIGVADTKELGQGLDKATRDVKRFGSELESAGMRLTAAISLPLIGVGAAALQAAGKMEQNRVAFTTLLKSADAAKSHLEDLQKFALVTPFQFEDLTKASRLMQAYGFSAQDVVPKLRTIGNAVSALGGGSDVLERVVRSMGEIGTRGRITGEQLRELSRAGIPALQAIADKLGISVSEAQQRITAGMVDAKTASDALLTYMDKRFAGGMEAQSKTILGMWSNVKDKLFFTLTSIGDAIIPWAKSFVADTLDPMLDKIKGLAEEFGKLPIPLQNIALGMAGLAVAVPLATFALGSLITNAIVIGGALGKLMVVLVPLATFVQTQAVAAFGVFATSLGAMSLAAGALASAGIAVLIVAMYKLIDAYYAMRDAAAASDAQEAQRLAALKRLEGALKQQGVDIAQASKEYRNGKLTLDEYVAALSALAKGHVAVHGAAKDAMDTQAALDALNIKSTATRKKELETAREAYEVLKKNGEGQQVLAEAALKVKQAEEALNGTLEKTTDKFHALTRETFDSAVNTEIYNRAVTRQGQLVKEVVDLRINAFRNAWHSFIADGPKVADAFEVIAHSMDHLDKLMDKVGAAVGDLKFGELQSSPFGKLADSAEYFGITTAHAYEMTSKTAQAKFDQMLKSGVATQAELAQAALMTAQAEIDADLAAGKMSAARHDQESRQIKEDLAQWTTAAKRKATLQEQIAMETKRLTASMFNSMERGLASDIVHWKGFAKTIGDVFRNLGEDILTIMFHALLKPVEKIFADLLTSIAEKLLGIFIVQKVAAASVDAGEVAGAAAVGGAAAAASTAAIPIIGPALAMEAGLAMYGAILGTFLPLALAGFSAKGGFGDVPFDGMPGILHAKEMVLPADIAVPLRAQLRNGGLGSGGFSIHIGSMSGVTRETVGMFAGQMVRQLRLSGARV